MVFHDRSLIGPPLLDDRTSSTIEHDIMRRVREWMAGGRLPPGPYSHCAQSTGVFPTALTSRPVLMDESPHPPAAAATAGSSGRGLAPCLISPPVRIPSPLLPEVQSRCAPAESCRRKQQHAPRCLFACRATANVPHPILRPNTRCKITTMVKNPKKALKSSSPSWRQSGAWTSRGRNLRFTYHT
jgi:hypothetical protein